MWISLCLHIGIDLLCYLTPTSLSSTSIFFHKLLFYNATTGLVEILKNGNEQFKSNVTLPYIDSISGPKG